MVCKSCACIAWTAEEIHQHRDHITHEELWSPSITEGGTSAKDVDGEQDGGEEMRDRDENMNSRTCMQPPPSVSVLEVNTDNANNETSNDYNTLKTRYSSFTLPEGWVLNDEEYVDKVANCIECSLYKDPRKLISIRFYKDGIGHSRDEPMSTAISWKMQTRKSTRGCW